MSFLPPCLGWLSGGSTGLPPCWRGSDWRRWLQRARKDLARELVADVRALDDRLKVNKPRMHDAVTESGTTLVDIAGVGPVVAARLLGRTGRASRFPTPAAFFDQQLRHRSSRLLDGPSP